MKTSILAIALSVLVASPSFATNEPCDPPVETPVETPVEPTPHVSTPKNTADPYVDAGPQYWTGTCRLLPDGRVSVHTAASFLKLFNKEKAMKLAGEQCIERLKIKGILQNY